MRWLAELLTAKEREEVEEEEEQRGREGSRVEDEDRLDRTEGEEEATRRRL